MTYMTKFAITRPQAFTDSQWGTFTREVRALLLKDQLVTRFYDAFESTAETLDILGFGTVPDVGGVQVYQEAMGNEEVAHWQLLTVAIDVLCRGDYPDYRDLRLWVESTHVLDDPINAPSGCIMAVRYGSLPSEPTGYVQAVMVKGAVNDVACYYSDDLSDTVESIARSGYKLMEKDALAFGFTIPEGLHYRP